MQATAKFWDGIAAKYARQPIRNEDAYRYTLARTQTYLGREDRVLEIGCGTGSTALLLAPETGEITATDISPEMIRIGEEKAKEAGQENIRFRAAGLEALSADGQPYDAVLALNLIHLLRDGEDAIRRIHTLLRKGGIFVSKTPCLPERPNPLFWAMRRGMIPMMQLLGKAPFVKFHTIPDLEKMITDAGFTILETSNHPAGPPPARYIVARKG